MRLIKTRIVCMVLICSIFFTGTVVVFADTKSEMNSYIGNQAGLGLKINSEISREKAEIYMDVMEQLREQNAEDLFCHYKNEIDPMIEMDVYERNGIQLASTSSKTYTLSNGGVVGYSNSIGGYVVKTCLTPSQFKKYVVNESKLKVGDVIEILLGFVPGWGTFFSSLFAINTIIKKAQINTVLEKGGYGTILNVSDISGANKGSSITVWSNHPKVVIPAGSSNIHVQKF